MRYSNHIVDETTHAFKCAKWFALVSSLLLGIFGTVLLIWPNTSMNVICTLLGVLMVVFGVSKIVGYFFNVSYHIGFQFDLALGLFALLFGILFLTHPGAVLSITWVLVGIYEIVESVFKIQTAMDARHYQLSGWGLLLFSAIVYLLFGIFLTFNPAKGGSLFVQVMGISLIFAGIENIIFTFYASKRLKDIRNRLHDEWIALDEDNIIDCSTLHTRTHRYPHSMYARKKPVGSQLRLKVFFRATANHRAFLYSIF